MGNAEAESSLARFSGLGFEFYFRPAIARPFVRSFIHVSPLAVWLTDSPSPGPNPTQSTPRRQGTHFEFTPPPPSAIGGRTPSAPTGAGMLQDGSGLACPGRLSAGVASHRTALGRAKDAGKRFCGCQMQMCEAQMQMQMRGRGGRGRSRDWHASGVDVRASGVPCILCGCATSLLLSVSISGPPEGGDTAVQAASTIGPVRAAGLGLKAGSVRRAFINT
ncbi:hypothetical protein C2E23DRAFT_101805 [Lenzites betulinus]|nr:hypothetical protein C2E23DRAFT_101805 [Lenzites betulinus]